MVYKPVVLKLQCASESSGLVRSQFAPYPHFSVGAGDQGAYFENCQQPAFQHLLCVQHCRGGTIKLLLCASLLAKGQRHSSFQSYSHSRR